MIELISLVKRYGGHQALAGISFTAQTGDVIGFLGPNGAGKTTTMRLIMGLLTPTSGVVRVNNLDPVRDRLEVLGHIGYLPENNPLYPEMTVLEYLRFVCGAKGSDMTKIEEIMRSVSLDDRASYRIEQLSRGYKQRVGLAAALIGDPSILILDEPTSGLDPIEQDKIKDLIRKTSKNKIIIFSTHILSEVESVANRLMILSQGTLVYDDEKPKRAGGVEKLFKKLVKV